MIARLRAFVAKWDNENPLDRWFRKKYKIAFNSEEHRRVNQLDVLTEWLEEQLVDEFEDHVKIEIKKEEFLKKGIWLSDSSEDIDDELEESLFNKLDISTLNKKADE